MFCPECGANLPDGTVFCSECGASLAAPQQYVPQQYEPQQYAAPVYQPQAGYPVYHGAPVNPLSKGDYIKQQASAPVKTAAKIVLILLAVCVAIMVIGHFSMLNTSIEKIPFMSFALDMSGAGEDEIDEMKDDMEYQLEMLEFEYELAEDMLDLSKKEEGYVEDLFDVLDDMSKTISVNNLKKMMDLGVKLADTDAAEYLDLEGSMDEVEEMSDVIGILSTGMLFAAIFSLLFTIIGAFTRVNVLVVLGAIGSALFAAVLYGFLFVLLIVAAHAAMIFMISKVNKEYKAYRNGTLPLAA